MNVKIRKHLANRKRRIKRRLKRSAASQGGGPTMAARNIHYEMSARGRGIVHGGLGVIHTLARTIGLIDAIDGRLQLPKIHQGYHESDHVLNLAYNALCDVTCLDDIELRRNDEVYLDALAAQRIPNPTTAGDWPKSARTVCWGPFTTGGRIILL